jgi:hypothetical protein
MCVGFTGGIVCHAELLWLMFVCVEYDYFYNKHDSIH